MGAEPHGTFVALSIGLIFDYRMPQALSDWIKKVPTVCALRSLRW